MLRELVFVYSLASVGLASGKNLVRHFKRRRLVLMARAAITMIPLLMGGFHSLIKCIKNFETCGLLAGASPDPPALAFCY